MQKQKLSILIYSLASGGAERVVSILAKKLQKKYEITIFLMNTNQFYDIPGNINIVYLEESSPSEMGIKKFLKLPFLAWKYKKLNKGKKSISFMNRSNYINVLAKLFGMKSEVIISERAMPSLQHQYGLQGFINRFLIRMLYKYADIITSNSLGNMYDLKDNFGCNNIITLNNPFEIENINTLADEQVEFRDNKFSFITVGRLDKNKNHLLMIDAMKHIDAKLYIIGKGELKKDLEKKILDDGLEDKVILLGEQKNPFKYLSRADCFIFSSNNEGFPNVLVEALACGLPIISTDCLSGPKEILVSKCNRDHPLRNTIELCEYGILTPVQYLKKLEEAMGYMIYDTNLRKNYKDKSKLRANDFHVDKIMMEYEEMLCVE